MITVREYIYNIKEKLKLTTDDSDITNNYIHHLLNIQRAYYIKQKFTDYRRSLPETIKQAITVDMELVDSTIGMTTNDKILRSKKVVPAFINLEGRADFIRILSRDFKTVPLSYVTFDRFPYVGNDKWNKGISYVTVGPDDKLYLKQGTGLGNATRLLVVNSIFENPEDAWMASLNYSSTINYLDTQYPISAELAKVAISEVVRELSQTLNIPEDNKNDSTETRQ